MTNPKNQDKKQDDDEKPQSKSPTRGGTRSNSAENDSMIVARQAEERLGLGLRTMYQSVLEEPLPDDMLALLDQLGDVNDIQKSDQHSDE